MSRAPVHGSLTTRLEGRTPDQLAQFFTATSAVEVTDLIRGTDDAELAALVADPEVRGAAVLGVLHRFGEFADPDRLAVLQGVALFDLTVPGRREPEPHVVAFSPAGVALLDDAHPADVVIGADVLDFVRLVTGQANAALLYLAGDLAVSGDEALALAVGAVFRLPGSGVVALDPMTLDPGEVATAVAASSTAHMREVMAGGFREVVLSEVFRRFPEFLRTDRAARSRLSVGFRVGGRTDGEADRYLVHVDRGACTVERDPAPDVARDATLILDGVDFLRLITGQLNPVTGVLRGTVKVKGDRAKALALNSIMERPHPAAR